MNCYIRLPSIKHERMCLAFPDKVFILGVGLGLGAMVKVRLVGQVIPWSVAILILSVLIGACLLYSLGVEYSS